MNDKEKQQIVAEVNILREVRETNTLPMRLLVDPKGGGVGWSLMVTSSKAVAKRQQYTEDRR